MTQRDKLIARFCSLPRDFKWEELVKLMVHLGYKLDERKGGSHKWFVNTDEDLKVQVPRPHPGNEVKPRYLQQVLTHLRENNLL